MCALDYVRALRSGHYGWAEWEFDLLVKALKENDLDVDFEYDPNTNGHTTIERLSDKP
jgi:hypothetical protein